MFVVQQDIINSSIYSRLKLSGDQRYNTLFRSQDHEEAEKFLNSMRPDGSLDNKRCPLRLIEMPDDAKVCYLRLKDEVV